MRWGVINNEMMGPLGMVASGMKEVMRTLELVAQAQTPTSSGYMRTQWHWERRANFDLTTMRFTLGNNADYAAARIAGVRPIRTPYNMEVGKTQAVGNPWPGPNRGITEATYRRGFAGRPIFDIALDVTWARHAL